MKCDGRPCMVATRRWIKGETIDGKYVVAHWESLGESPGTFLAWGMEHEEFTDGIGNYTVAIVEMPDGTVRTPLPGEVRFCAKTIEKPTLAGFGQGQ